ncbi:hypothetical protein FHY55_04480 [Oceanicola sp. D3]|uniref:hypothetical protein n=1 Tax=Oceanicola sp. D3 TaxID=2587163 RepID=UPI00111D39DC|nr:hypothetical protein [Oceanicola sp. D3]QDC08540.1 hypothetical protein FHY55_04480 [Oceanicola sp. D3]
MNILIGTILLWGLVALTWVKLASPARRRTALTATANLAAFTLPRLFVAMIGAALLAELMPADRIEQLFGRDAGLRALLLATLLGPITPGGAFVSFALAAAALKVGATPAAALTYVTSWSLFSLTKLLAYEMPFMGARTMAQRLALSLPIPLVVGAIASLF